MKYMGENSAGGLVINCTLLIHFYFSLVNVDKGIATWGKCMRKKLTFHMTWGTTGYSDL